MPPTDCSLDDEVSSSELSAHSACKVRLFVSLLLLLLFSSNSDPPKGNSSFIVVAVEADAHWLSTTRVAEMSLAVLTSSSVEPARVVSVVVSCLFTMMSFDLFFRGAGGA